MIELDGIRKMFGTVVAAKQVSLAIPDHARFAITGPSGSGKTTLLRIIAGLEVPDEGTVTLDGRIANDPGIRIPPAERGIGFVFQTAALWPHMTVGENILFALNGTPPAEAEKRLNGLLDRMSAARLRDRYPDQISGGEARRIALARALAPKPSILLFDEPLTNLDDELREDLLTLIDENVRASRACMIYVTHNRNEAAVIADTVLNYRNGEIITP
jgi:iron(III) transport system ATP-binding protein